MCKRLPVLSSEMNIFDSLLSRGLTEWQLRVEGVPMRGLEWITQYPCIVQDVTESVCCASDASMWDLCRLTFQLTESHQFVRFGTRFLCRFRSCFIEITLSRIGKIANRAVTSSAAAAAADTATTTPLSDTHYLVEMTTRSSTSDTKRAAQALYGLHDVLQPWVVASLQ